MGGEMVGNANGTQEWRSDELMHLVLRRITFGHAHLRELEIALRTGDRDRLITAAANLHDTWALAETTTLLLRQRAERKAAHTSERWHHEVARNALLAGRYFAREPLTRMWAVLREDVRRRAQVEKQLAAHDQESVADRVDSMSPELDIHNTRKSIT
jgi:hypothetical protein